VTRFGEVGIRLTACIDCKLLLTLF
jgi:hypothetical protein